MMELVVANRCSGKTVKLIKQSAVTGIPIMVNNNVSKKYIESTAKRFELTIPDPVVITDYVKNGFHKEHKQFLIDELEACLLAIGIDPAMVTIGINSGMWNFTNNRWVPDATLM